MEKITRQTDMNVIMSTVAGDLNMDGASIVLTLIAAIVLFGAVLTAWLASIGAKKPDEDEPQDWPTSYSDVDPIDPFNSRF